MGKNKSDNKHHPYKKQNYHKSKNIQSGTIPIGTRGFLCTFNTMKKFGEKHCMKEAFNILDEYWEKIQCSKSETKESITEEKVKSSCDDVDIEDELKSELDELKSNDKKKQRFQKLDTGAQGNMFLKMNDKSIDPVTLGTSIVEDLYSTKQQKTVHLLRFIPVEITCKAYLDDIGSAFQPLLLKYFSGEPTSYCIVFNKRNNNNLNRMEVIEYIALLIKEKNFFHSVNLSQATLTIVAEVIKSVCCLSVLPHYTKYKKYNLCEITYPEDRKNNDCSGKSGSSKSETQVVNEESVEDNTELTNEESVGDKKELVDMKPTEETEIQ